MEYSGLENVYLNGTMIGFSREEIDAKLEDILNFADIGDFIHQPVKTYSSGMFVRLAFAVAINIEPEILIVDEALSVGDVFFQAKCYRKFEEFKKMGRTILFVSHDLGSISKYCDRVVLLNKGKKVAEGKPKEMVDLYKKILVGQDVTVIEEIKEETHKLLQEEERSYEHDGEIWKKYMLINPDLQSYGDGRAEIIDFGIFDEEGKITNTVYKMQDFTLRMKAEFNKDTKSLFCFQKASEDLKRTELTEYDTVIEKTETGTLSQGEVVEISFTQKMRLQGGQYLLQLGCTGFEGNDDFVVYHRLYDICCIQVIADKTTVGYFDMDTRVNYAKGAVHE